MVRKLGKRFFILLNLFIAAALVIAYLATSINPDKIVIPAFFGISYPVWIALNILFVLFWLVQRKIWFLISFITILAGWNHFNNFFQLMTKSSKTSSGNLVNVMSYNVKLFDWYNWRNNIKTRDLMYNQLHEASPDIVCFQEFFHHKAKEGKKEFTTPDTLKKILDANYVHDQYTLVLKNEEHYGIATFSRYPIINKGRIKFRNEKGNLCIFSDIVIGNDTVRVYNAHVASIRFSPEDYRFMEELSDREKEAPPIQGGINILKRLAQAFKRRSHQVETILDHISQSPYPVILCGDFNDTPVSYSYARLSENLKDSFRESGWGVGTTYAGRFPAFRIDYIFHDPKFDSYNYKTLPEKWSDHQAIMTSIELPSGEE